MPYISATAEIMYAPLDLRFVMTLETALDALPNFTLPNVALSNAGAVLTGP